MEDETHAGAWPAEVWLAGEEPKKEQGQAEPARGNVVDKLDVKEKLGPKVEDVKETLGPKLEEARDKLGPKLEKAKGKFGQTVRKLFRKN